MKFLLPLRFGFRAARRHPRLVVLLYLVSLVPALLTASLAVADLAPEVHGSLFAERALEAGQRFAVWSDYRRADGSDFSLVTTTLLVLTLLTFAAQVLASAGIVEALMQREHHREHPFLLGIGRHGGRFLRMTIWFVLTLLPVLWLAGFGFGRIDDLAKEAHSGLYHLWGWAGVVALVLLLYAALDLAFDLARVACAAHEDRRTFVGYFKALGHTLRHPLILLPVWLAFLVPVLALHLAYLAGRHVFDPASLGPILLVLLVQQVVFLLAAFFRVGLWGAEVAYYQAVGEPPWCGRRRKRGGRTERAVSEETPRETQDGEAEGEAALGERRLAEEGEALGPTADPALDAAAEPGTRTAEDGPNRF